MSARTVTCCNVRNTTGPFAKAIFFVLPNSFTSCLTESQQYFLVSFCLRHILTVIISDKSTTKCQVVRSPVHLRIQESQLLSQAPVALGFSENNSLTTWADCHSVVLNFQSQQRALLYLLKLDKKIPGPKADWILKNKKLHWALLRWV